MMIQSRISNIPFLDGANDMFTTTNKSHFKPFDNTAIQKRNVILRPVSTLLQRGDNNYQRKHQTETASSFTSHPRTVTLPTMTHRTMQRTNFKMHSEKRCGDFETNVTHADFKPLPMSAAKIIRPTTSVRISLPGSKFPETTHRSSYTKHEVSSDRRAKETVNTGVGSTLKENKKDEFSSSYHEQFQYRWCPPPLLSAEKVILISHLQWFQRQPIMLQFNNIFLSLFRSAKDSDFICSDGRPRTEAGQTNNIFQLFQSIRCPQLC
ncbi:hypothetical protein F2P79_006158 [Pimephales promelas]|nr:hypothetical protein F2P79_006158 [Pimephales promelas]